MLGYGASTHRDCHDSQMQAANLCLLIRLGLVTRFLTAPQHRGRGHLEPASVRPDLLHHLGPAPGTAHHQPGPVPGAPQARPPRRPRHPAHPAGDALHRPRPRAARKSPVAAPVRHRRPRRGNPHPQHRRPRPRVPPRPRHQQGRRHRVRALGHLHRPHPAPPAGRPHRRAGVPGRPARPCLRISRARGRCARRSRTRLYCDRGVACPPITTAGSTREYRGQWSSSSSPTSSSRASLSRASFVSLAGWARRLKWPDTTNCAMSSLRAPKADTLVNRPAVRFG